ncbi:hypothetical protein [Micromonospora sp. NPDC049374]|uniref:hypothetical protein n=1 Tax=Micromonospora sp. NPDC049374 TaxID=3154352 RepID=UPI003421B242
MDIINQSISASQSGNRWTLSVPYIETFTAAEISQGFEFERWVTFWEWDDSDHDHLTNGAAVRFRPTSVRLSRRWTWSDIPGDVLDTELGGEEIRAQLFLRNFTTSSVAISKFTPILQIAPD